MNSDAALQLLSQLIWNTIWISAPILACSLIVGILVSVAQVVTQVQDMSLSFIPKLLATAVALGMFGPWMLRKLVLVATSVIANIPNYF